MVTGPDSCVRETSSTLDLAIQHCPALSNQPPEQSRFIKHLSTFDLLQVVSWRNLIGFYFASLTFHGQSLFPDFRLERQIAGQTNERRSTLTVASWRKTQSWRRKSIDSNELKSWEWKSNKKKRKKIPVERRRRLAGGRCVACNCTDKKNSTSRRAFGISISDRLLSRCPYLTGAAIYVSGGTRARLVFAAPRADTRSCQPTQLKIHPFFFGLYFF